MGKENEISLNSKIAVGLVLAIVGAAVSFGVQLQKINDLDRRMVRVEEKLDKALEVRGLTLKK